MSLNQRSWDGELPEVDRELAARGMFTIKAAAAYTGYSEGLLRKAIRQGELKATKRGKGYRITKRDLDAFLGIDTP